MKQVLRSIVAVGLLFAATQSKAQLGQYFRENNPVFEKSYIEENTAPLDLSGPYAQVNGVIFYPNPVASQARILLPAPSAATVKVEVISLQGTLMRSFHYAPGGNALDVDMSPLATGIYNVRVIDGRNITNMKIVKE